MNRPLIALAALAAVLLSAAPTYAGHRQQVVPASSAGSYVPDNSGRLVFVHADPARAPAARRQGRSHAPAASAAAEEATPLPRARPAPSQADHTRWPKARFARGGAELLLIDCAGVQIKAARSAAGSFAGFCLDMAAAGYRPIARFTNAYRPWGTCQGCDMHPRGLALDFDQLRRDRTAIRMSRSEVSAIARRHGLISGGDWCDGDLGHFEVNTGRNAGRCGGRRNLYASVRHYQRRREAKAL